MRGERERGEQGERAEREGREGGEQVICGENSDSQRAGVTQIIDRVKEEGPAEGEESWGEKEGGTV